jgi:PAS domain S-box-containing protein
MTEGDLVHELRQLRTRVTQLENELAAARDSSRDQAEHCLMTLADSAPLMLWLAGTDGHCTFFNRRWLSFRGRTMEEEAGRGWAEGIHPEDRSNCVDTWLGAFHSRREFQLEYRLRRHDGEYRWIAAGGVPRFDPGGAFAGFMSSGVDIHDFRSDALPVDGLPLTQRERQVLVLITEGKSTKELAALLGISYKTADSHRSKIMEKLDIHETATLVRYAIRHRLVKP